MVMVVVMVETMSSIMATGDIVGKQVTASMLRNGLNTCGLATTICGFFNLFPLRGLCAKRRPDWPDRRTQPFRGVGLRRHSDADGHFSPKWRRWWY